MDFTSRHKVAELMDQPGLDEQLHRQALRGLRRVNWFSRSSGILWSAIRDLANQVLRRWRCHRRHCPTGETSRDPDAGRRL